MMLLFLFRLHQIFVAFQHILSYIFWNTERLCARIVEPWNLLKFPSRRLAENISLWTSESRLKSVETLGVNTHRTGRMCDVCQAEGDFRKDFRHLHNLKQQF